MADAPNPTEAPLVIDRVGAQGDGFARGSSGDVFVPFALPGEHWRASIGTPNSYALASAPSSVRVQPPCPHFGRCGGCVAQHMSSAFYAEWKRGIVVDAFRHRGIEADVTAMVGIAPHSRRRATLTVVRADGGVALGYHARASHTVCAIEQCPVLAPAIETALPVLRSICDLVMPKAAGAELRLTITRAKNGLDVALSGRVRKLAQPDLQKVAALAQQARIQRLMADDEALLAGSSPVTTIDGVDITLPDTAFLQAVEEAEIAMRRLVVDAVGTPKSKKARVADLFCGLGTFTFALARSAPVFAVDGDKAAIDALADGARRARGIKPIEARRRDLFRDPLSARELAAFEAVVIDPPRAGAAAQVAELARSTVKRVVMVSCNPATLARDVRTLIDGGYRLGTVTPIDQFLYSGHVEAVAVLTR